MVRVLSALTCLFTLAAAASYEEPGPGTEPWIRAGVVDLSL